jgi:Dihaem cytochrome c
MRMSLDERGGLRRVPRRAVVAGRLALIAGMAAISLAVAGCQGGKLPDESGYAAQLYIKRCGGCHVPYNPRSMTAAMWKVQMAAMQDRMRQAGMTPLTPDERARIMGYLQRYAGHS